MNDDTTIIILIREPSLFQINNIRRLEKYALKHKNINKIIIQPTKQNEKKALIKSIKKSDTQNIILFEQEFYTSLNQIRHQIKKLRKTDIVLPNRFSTKSITRYEDDNIRRKDELRRILPQIFSSIPYHDINNPNKAFKKDKILPLLKKTRTNNNYWTELIYLAHKEKLRITETSTHYHQKNTRKEIMLIEDIRDLIKI